MRREGDAGAGGGRAAVRCERRGLAGRRGEADPAGAQLRGPGECGDAGGAAGRAPRPRLGAPLPGAGTAAAAATGKRAAGLRNVRGRPDETRLFETAPKVQPRTGVAWRFPSAVPGGVIHGQLSLK